MERLRKDSIDQLAQWTQRVIVRNALLQRRVAEQLVLFEVESTHRLGSGPAEEDGRHFARAKRTLAFFNGLLEDQAATRSISFFCSAKSVMFR